MPVKNRRLPTNDQYLGEITGLTEKEKKVLEEAGIGGGGDSTKVIIRRYE